MNTAKERPIIFTGESVRAIIAGKKTQTRRLKWRGESGERRWVREAFITGYPFVDDVLQQFDKDGNDVGCKVWYRADPWITWANEDGYTLDNPPWRSPIFMNRAYSRIDLEVVSVRVEHVQDITDSDAIAEGVTVTVKRGETEVDTYRQLWDKINANKGFGWDKNPLVYVVEFKVLEVRNDRP